MNIDLVMTFWYIWCCWYGNVSSVQPYRVYGYVLVSSSIFCASSSVVDGDEINLL